MKWKTRLSSAINFGAQTKARACVRKSSSTVPLASISELASWVRETQTSKLELLSSMLRVEHLHDPRGSLSDLRNWLTQDSRRRAVICQEAVVNQETNSPPSLPESPEHVRCWALNAYQSLLKEFGFFIESSLAADTSQFYLLSSSKAEIERARTEAGLPLEDLGALLVSSELTQAPGIETPFLGLPAIFSALTEGDASSPESVLELLQVLLCYYPSLEQIVLDEAGGLGVRIVQAQESGLLPNTLKIYSSGTGSSLRREVETGSWLPHSELNTLYQEKIILERSVPLPGSPQAAVNRYPEQGYKPRKSGETPRSEIELFVVIPFYNIPAVYLDDLIWALNQQTLSPKKVFVVNDGSAAEFRSELPETLSRLEHPWEILDLAQNQGIAGARNAALECVDSGILVNLDADDVPRNDFLARYAYTLSSQLELAACSCYAQSFSEQQAALSIAISSPESMPLGDGLLLAQTTNCLGHANSAFRVETLKSLGGWDREASSMYEDWAVMLKLLSTGHALGIVPETLCFIRQRVGSSISQIKQYPAQQTLARNTLGLPRFDALRLQGLLRSLIASELQLNTQLKEQTLVLEQLLPLINELQNRR